jgi:hypothetical protein
MAEQAAVLNRILEELKRLRQQQDACVSSLSE